VLDLSRVRTAVGRGGNGGKEYLQILRRGERGHARFSHRGIKEKNPKYILSYQVSPSSPREGALAGTGLSKKTLGTF